MIISYYGGQFIKIVQGDMTIAFNPPSKDSKLKSSKFGADIALVSLNDKDFNGIDNLSHGDKKPFVISGPGEYEVKGSFIKGIATNSLYGGEKKINTIYTVSIDNINICFIGALTTNEISSETKEKIGMVDILFIPIGGDGVLDPKSAHKLSNSFEPNIVIPLQYNADNLEIFLKEEGVTNGKPLDKLTIKKKDLDDKKGEIIVLVSN